MSAVHVQTAFDEYRTDRNRAALIRILAILGLLAIAFGSIAILNIPIERLLDAYWRIGGMISNRLFPPDLDYAFGGGILRLLVQSIEMSIVGAVIGSAIAIPLAWFGAWNVTPSRTLLYPLARLAIVLGRAVPSMMWGLILVAVLGF